MVLQVPDWYRTRARTEERALLSSDEGHKAYSLSCFRWALKFFPEGSTILDVGCGDGLMLEKFLEVGFHPIGVSLNVAEVRIARKKGLDARVVDMHDLAEFGESKFDVVWCRHTLEHSLSPYCVLLEVYRVLKPNGHVIIVLPSQFWDDMPLHYSLMNGDQLQTYLVKVGFTLVLAEVQPMLLPGVPKGKSDDYEIWEVARKPAV